MANKRISIKTHSADETRKLGQKIGTLTNRPLIIALSGDLGSGKTAFVQGLAMGLEVPDDYYITSPTFTLPSRKGLVSFNRPRLKGVQGRG